MLRKIFFVAFLCLAILPVSGQGIQLGIFFDPVITWLKSDVGDVSRSKARMGFDFGLKTDFYFAKNYAFSTGLSLFNMGGTLQYDNGITLHVSDSNILVPQGGEVKYKIQYLRIPAGLNLRTHQIGRFVYFANLGFDLMMKVSAKAGHGGDNFGISKDIKAFNTAYHIGGGIEYSLGADASLIFGLTFMNTFADITKPSHDKISSNNLHFHIGVLF